MQTIRWLSALLLAALAGCAGVPADWGRAEVARLSSEAGRPLPDGRDAAAISAQALAAPLTADTAVQLALLNNPALRREMAGLGFAAAEVYEAGRLANPLVSMARLSPGDAAGERAQLTLGIAFNFVNLLFLPANHRFAASQMESAKLAVAASVLELATDVEAAWYGVVAAEQLAQMRNLAEQAQRASAQLAQRYFAAGNISRRALAMENAAASQATLAAITARARALETRTQLNRLMGLGAERSDWRIKARLPEPLAQDAAVAELQQLALRHRLDVASRRRNAEAIAARYGLARRARWVNGIEIGVEWERDYDGAIHLGPTLALELPLFNWGGGRVAAARAALEQAEAELDARVLDMSNGVQLAAARMTAAKALAEEYRGALVPARETVVAEAQKEHNYMLVGIFEVILAKQQEYEAYAGYIEAVRDYWSARAELARAVGRRLPGSEQPLTPTADPALPADAEPAPPASHQHPPAGAP